MKKAFLVLLASLLVASCGQKVEDRVIGKWAIEGYEELHIEFFADNTFFRAALPLLEEGTGKWIVLDDSRLKLTDDSDNSILLFEELQISGGKMTFLEDGHDPETLVRIE